MRAYLGRILTSLGDSHADTKMPERVRADLERVHGFHLLQPHDLVRRSLIDSGIDPQRIEVLHNSRRDLQAQDFLGSEPVWVIGDRHAFKYPEGDYVQRLSGMLEDDPRVRLLRLPLETFFRPRRTRSSRVRRCSGAHRNCSWLCKCLGGSILRK